MRVRTSSSYYCVVMMLVLVFSHNAASIEVIVAVIGIHSYQSNGQSKTQALKKNWGTDGPGKMHLRMPNF